MGYKMVDKKLLEELNAIREAGPENAPPDTVLKVFEVFKQLAQEDEDLKEEVEDADLCMQFVVTDKDYKYWIAARDGEISYGDGDGPDVTVTLKAAYNIMAGMLSQEVDATSAYMAGDLVIEGNLQDAMQFGEIAGLAGEIMEDMNE